MTSTPYSRNTFEEFAKVRHYVSVRLKQGVPLVDADINELQDLRRYEVRNFVRWFVGNGVPPDNDGFRIQPSPDANDVVIAGGDGTPERAGRCLVDGMEVLNEDDVAFSEQEFADPSAAADAGVDPVTMPETPASGTRTDLYYLDVWEREVTSADAGHEDIVDTRIAVESARRIRREWAVRVVDEATGVPSDDNPAGHRYYPLASVLRVAGQDGIDGNAIRDLRRRDVTVQSRANLDQVALDAFGSDYSLDETGRASLPMSLRDVINAMLRDGRPAIVGPREFQTEFGPHDLPTSAVDADGQQWVFWMGPTDPPSTSDRRVFFQRQVAGTWTTPMVAFEASGNFWEAMDAVGAPDGSMWLFYSARVSGDFTIVGRRFEDGSWGAEFTVATTPRPFGPAAAIDDAGNVLVAWREDQDDEVWSRLYVDGTEQSPVRVADSSEPVAAQIGVTTDEEGEVHLYAVEQPGSDSWPVRMKTWNGSAWDATYTDVASLSVDTFLDFAVARDRFDATWLIWATRKTAGTTVLRARRVGTDTGDVLEWLSGAPRFPSALRDAAGNLQVFFRDEDLDRLDVMNIVYEV